MVHKKTSSDEKWVKAVWDEVDKLLKAKGYPLRCDLQKLRREMDKLYEDFLAWDPSGSGFEEAVNDLAQVFLKRLHREGELPRVPSPPPAMRATASSAFAAMTLGRIDVRRLTQQVRETLWGSPMPPFDTAGLSVEASREQVEAAETWLVEQRRAAGTALAELEGAAQKLVDLTEWWTIDGAKMYVLTGLFPNGVVHWEIKRRAQHHLPVTITMTIEQPFSPREVAQLYRDYCESQGLKLPLLSMTQVAVLHLVADLPNSTWKERLEVWDQWRKTWAQHSDRKKRGGLAPFDPPHREKLISTAYSRALKKANWEFSEGDSLDILAWDRPLSFKNRKQIFRINLGRYGLKPD